MNKENIIKHFAIIGWGTVVVLFINLVTAPIITRLVSPDEYGIQSIFTMYASILASFFYLGQDQSLLRFFYLKDEDAYKRTLLYRSIKYPFILCVAFNTILIGIIVTGIMEIRFKLEGMVCFCIYVMVLVMDRFASLLLRLSYKTKQFSMVNMTSKLFYLIFSVSCIFTIRQHYSTILILATILSAIFSLGANILVQKDYWDFRKGHLDQNCPSMKEIFKYGAPFIISGGIAVFFNFIDKMTIHIFGTYSDIGIYSSAIGMVNLFSIIQTTFCTLWSPLTFDHHEKNPDDRSLYIKGHNIITLIVFFVGLTMILGKDMFIVILGEEYRDASYLLPFLLFNPIMMTVSETTVSGLYFAKKTKLQIIPPLVACMVNIIGNLNMVPLLGGKGAAISTGISYIIFFTMRTILGCRYYPIRFNLKAYYTITGLTVLYAFYSTFFAFHIFMVIGYVICIGCLVILYRNTIKELSFYIKSLIKNKNGGNQS